MMFVSEAAMLLWFDVLPETIAEHDEWHTREHFPERIAIPGFRRASRWIAEGDGPRYLVCYEVDDIAVLSSPAYLERLNHPSEWTRRMMPNYRGMTRAFFDIRHVVGEVLGGTIVSVRFEPMEGGKVALQQWLIDTLIPSLCTGPGVSGAALFASTQKPEMTAEQRIRGRDAGAGWVLLVSVYDARKAGALIGDWTDVAPFTSHIAEAPKIGTYKLACLSTAAG